MSVIRCFACHSDPIGRWRQPPRCVFVDQFQTDGQYRCRDHLSAEREQEIQRREHEQGWPKRRTAMTAMNGILDALTHRLIALGSMDQAIAPKHAAIMICGWDKFTDYDSQETGARQCDSWMDEEVVRLLDAALNAHWLGGEPYPAAAGMSDCDDARRGASFRPPRPGNRRIPYAF